MSRLARKVNWEAGGDQRVPYVATVDGERWEVRLGDAKAGALYTLVVNGTAVEELNEWPETWLRPSAKPGEGWDGTTKDDEDPYQKREMEIEEEKFKRSLSIKPSKRVQ